MNSGATAAEARIGMTSPTNRMATTMQTNSADSVHSPIAQCAADMRRPSTTISLPARRRAIAS